MASLFTALSGLKAHQDWIDVIGNNLANANTSGFKTSHASFSSSFHSTLRHASGPGGGMGGRNPVQIGMGVSLSDIGRDFGQGSLTGTGRVFDLALQGRGFFALSNGAQTMYTRVGTFGLDGQNNLVDQRTGYRVLDGSGSAITLDTDSVFAPQATSNLELVGNLPKEVTGPLQEVLTGAQGFKQGTSAVVASTNAGPYTIPAGETWSFELSISGAAPRTVSVTSATGTVTAADVAAAVDALDGVGASVNGAGQVEITTDRVGEAASIRATAGPTNRDLAGILGLPTTLVRGTETSTTATTDLNDLPGRETPYQDGDQISITGLDSDGTPINATFTYGAGNDGTSVDDFVAFLDNLYDDATVSMNAAGQLVVEADTAGETDLMLSIEDASGNAGTMDWNVYAAQTTTEGTGPDEVIASMEVYDPAGVAHTLTVTFERQQDGSWNAVPSVPASEGTVLSAPITGITFDDAGNPVGLGGVDTEVLVQFTGQTLPQAMTLELGAGGSFGGLTQYGAEGEVAVRTQDGYGVGNLANISVDGDGSIVGFYTNGQSRDLGAVGVALFTNPEGLQAGGDGLYLASANSGAPILGSGLSGAAGEVVGGALENSNVDTAEQFVRLIEAQRGFQANARVITAQDEVLRETVNLV
jgi:flagellar hook protein FlgE